MLSLGVVVVVGIVVGCCFCHRVINIVGVAVIVGIVVGLILLLDVVVSVVGVVAFEGGCCCWGLLLS